MNLRLVHITARLCALFLISIAFASIATATERSGIDASRGKLLYSVHCVACHNEQKHWLANKKVSDWPSLVSQVRLWQNISNLKWDNNDIESVAVYLNTLYYHYPSPNTMAQKK